MFAGVFAQTSIVGYQTVENIAPGATITLAVQFTDVSGDNIVVKDLVTVGTPAGASGATTSADQIWTYNPTDGWLKYYYFRRGDTAQWRKVGETKETVDSFSPGTSFFFVRGTSGNTTSLTLAGAVKPLSEVLSYSLKAGETVMMCHPWPYEVPVASFGDFFESGSLAGASGATTSADQIWR